MTKHPNKVAKKRMTTTIILLAIFVPLSLIALGIARGIDDWSRDLTTNRASTDPAAEHPLMQPVTQRFSIEQLDAVIDDICRDQPAWSRPAESKPVPSDSLIKTSDKPLAVRHLVRTSKWMQFRDDVWLIVEPAPGDWSGGDEKLRLHIESRSRLGKGDLGQNPRNVLALNELLVSQLIVKAPPPTMAK